MSMNWLPGLDLSGGTVTFPFWVAGVVAALIVALLVIAILRAGLDGLGAFLFRVAVIAAVAVFGGTYLNRSGERDRADERRALDQRSTDLTGRAIAPGSAIACLEATSGDAVEGACERAVFASPETVAAATSYVAARLTLLADAHDFAMRRDTNYETTIAGLRRMVAADRFGLASQVLAARDGCTPDNCDAFNLVYDDKKLRTNLRERLFDQLVGRYAINWPSRAYRPVVSTTTPTGTPTASTSNLQFPSAQSIPPVSIMNNEPPPAPEKPPQASAPAAATPSPNAAAETKSPTKRAPRPAPPATAAANGATTPPPMSLAPAKQSP
ncbi:MAG: hypothetical protein QOG38_2084 [Hyphomicrobiales bacterium]|nr:hypothetical protein [Hyphomicrobiales bacterium]